MVRFHTVFIMHTFEDVGRMVSIVGLWVLQVRRAEAADLSPVTMPYTTNSTWNNTPTTCYHHEIDFIYDMALIDEFFD